MYNAMEPENPKVLAPRTKTKRSNSRENYPNSIRAW